jgi:hypothetical protein
MTDVQYEEGKVYLRDVRSGQIHLYERNLERNANFEVCIPNPVQEVEDTDQAELDLNPENPADNTGDSKEEDDIKPQVPVRQTPVRQNPESQQ